MLDQCIITVPNGPLVKPEIFTDEHFKIDDWLEFHAVSNSNNRRWHRDGPLRSGKWNFDLFGDRELRFRTKHVSTRKDEYRQVIDRIELNLAKIAHGHNAIPIRHEQELCGLLILVRHVLSGVLVDPSKASILIPGLVKDSGSHWSKIEIGMHIKDPGRSVYNLMQRMRSTRARKLEFFDNTVRLKGTNVILKVYDKAVEMVAKKQAAKRDLHPSTDDPITRLEVELTNKKAASFHFLPEDQRPLIRQEDNKQYLEGFTLEQLKAIHRDYFSELKGVYHSRKKLGEGDQAGMAAVLAAVHLRTGIPVEHLLDIYVELGMRDKKKPHTHDEETKAKKRARRDIRVLIERFLEESSTLTADELFSDKAYRSQPIIGVENCYGAGKFYIGHYGISSIWEFSNDPHADRQIQDVYMAHNSKRIRPVTELTWWTWLQA